MLIGSQAGVILSFRGHFWLSQQRDNYWHLGLEAEDATKHPTILSTGPHNQELSGPKCQ